MKKLILLFLAFALVPQVFADIIAPSYQQTFGTLFLIFLANYGINFILIFIQSKIWLDIEIKRIFIGLLIITPILMIIEGLISGGGSLGLSLFVKSLILIFLAYVIIGKFYWKLENTKIILTSIIMGVITNPYWLFKIIF